MKKISLFYKILITFLLVLIVGICVSLIYVWNWLKDYQAGLPIYMVDNIVTEIKSGDFEEIVDKYNFNITDFEEKDAVVSFLRNGFKDYEKITYKKMYSREGNLYAIYADDLYVFNVNLVRKDNRYEVSKSELNTKISVQIDLPKGFSLYINDVKVDSKWIEEAIDEDNSGFKLLYCMKERVIESYRVTGLLKQAFVKVKDHEGNDVELDLDKKLKVSYRGITFRVPDTCNVYIDGDLLSEEFCTQTDIESDIIGVTLKEYEVNGIIGDFTYVIKDKTDREMLTVVNDGKVSLKKITYTIDSPKGYSVYVNGNKLSESNITARDVEVKALQYIPDKYVTKPTYDRYTVDVLGILPDVAVKNKDGFEVKIESKDEKSVAQFNIPEDDAKEYYPLVQERAFMYSKYVTEDLSWGNLEKVLKPDTEIYETYKTLQPYFYTDHIRYEFKNVEIGNLQMYADNCISCDISYDHYVYKTEKEIFTFPSDFTFYLVKDGGNWYIMDFVIN